MLGIENNRIKKQIDTLMNQESEIRSKLNEIESIAEMIADSEDLTDEFKSKYKKFCAKFSDEIEHHLNLSENCVEYLRSKQNCNN